MALTSKSSVLRRLVIAAMAVVAPSLASAQAPPSSRPAAHSVVDDKTEAAIQGALKFLASKQLPGGGWAGSNSNHQAAITAYVLVAFLANGNVPGEGPYGKVVQRGVDYLLDCVRPDGYIAAPTGEHNMYGHGIATIVLGEVYGMTGAAGAGGGGGNTDQRLKPALERAVRLIVQTQNAQGGWRYQPRVADADISVTVLQATALRVAKNSGIDVPQRTIDRAATYVRSCFDEQTGGFYYQSGAGNPGFARTCAAIYTLQVLGYYDDPMVKRGSDYAAEQFGKQMEWFTYGNFYGAPAHFMIGGDAWDHWYAGFKKIVLPKLVTEGEIKYWKPIEGGNGQNDVFATAVYVTVLSLPYGYLPLYQR